MKGKEAYGELKKAIEELWVSKKLIFPQKPRVHRAYLQIQKTWGDGPTEIPKPFELREVCFRVQRMWRDNVSIDRMPARDVRWIPWAMFIPEENPSQWLASDRRFLNQYLSYLGSGYRTSALLSFLKALLLHYPRQLPNFDGLLAETEKLVFKISGARLKIWRERCENIGLLQPDGPSRLANALFRSGHEFNEHLEEAGFDGQLTDAYFLKYSLEELLDIIKRDFRHRRILSNTVLAVLEFLKVNDGLRYESLRAKIADSFLLPFTHTDPDAELKNKLQSFFLQLYGDPRIPPTTKWRGCTGAKEVVLRWLVRVTLENFFNLIGKMAFEQHWKYRRDFWLAYVKEDYIRDAWVAFAPGLYALAQRSYGFVGGYAKLAGAQSNHAVLLMKIGDLVIAEWSHAGACRIWKTSKREAPKMYQEAYSGFSLKKGEDFYKAHHGSEQGHWQAIIANYIREQTGVRLARR